MTNQLVYLLIIIPLLLTPTLVFGHENYTQSKGCSSTNMTSYWYNNICQHQPPPRAVATTSFHCYNTKEGETCESGTWIPVHQATMTALNPNNYHDGYQYGIKDWDYWVPGGPHDNGVIGHHFECPLSRTAPHSDFCKGYDAALMYENSDQ